jgi:hypothetical protein
VLGKGGGLGQVGDAVLQNLYWLGVSAVAAGCLGATLSLPLRRPGSPHWAVGFALWAFIALLAANVGVLVGMYFNGWFLALQYNRPHVVGAPDASFIGIVLAISLLPMVAVALVSYPVFLLLRRRIYRAVPAVSGERARVRLSPAIVLVLTLALAAISPRFTGDGLANYRGDERRAAETALQVARGALDQPFERSLVVQKLEVAGIKTLPAEGGAGSTGQRYKVGVSACGVFWIPYANFTVTYAEGEAASLEGGRLYLPNWARGWWASPGVLALLLLLLGGLSAVGAVIRAHRRTV